MRINRKTRNTIIISVIVVFGLAIAVTCAYLVYKTIIINNTTSDYNNIASSYAANINEDIDTNADNDTPDATEKKSKGPIDFDSLMAKNDEVYAWIVVPNTQINYPVLQSNSEDNFYLSHDINKRYSFPGAIYSQSCNSKDFTDRVTLLYGHNMANGSMFAGLHKYEDKTFFDENPYFYIYTPGHKLTYEVASALIYDDRHIMNSFDFTNDEVYQKFIDSLLSPHSVNANVREGASVTINDKIVILSTCPNSGQGRYLVQGVLISDEPT